MHCTKNPMQLQKFFDPILWLQACQCLCTRRKFAHKQFPFPLIQSITQSTQFHPSLNTKIYTFDLLPFHSSLQIHISLWTLRWVGLLRVSKFRSKISYYNCTFSKLWNPRISKLLPLLNMLENCVSISISEKVRSDLGHYLPFRSSNVIGSM